MSLSISFGCVVELCSDMGTAVERNDEFVVRDGKMLCRWNAVSNYENSRNVGQTFM